MVPINEGFTLYEEASSYSQYLKTSMIEIVIIFSCISV